MVETNQYTATCNIEERHVCVFSYKFDDNEIKVLLLILCLFLCQKSYFLGEISCEIINHATKTFIGSNCRNAVKIATKIIDIVVDEHDYRNCEINCYQTKAK